MTETHDIIGIDQAARMLGMSEKSIRRHLKEIPHVAVFCFLPQTSNHHDNSRNQAENLQIQPGHADPNGILTDAALSCGGLMWLFGAGSCGLTTLARKGAK